ncbi:hypothetical protein DSAG12_00923 [Promethearchaeum syntrophicum]|uniref:Uncharacterized protein n=1 Tax=Promethearchaeum syntrophicum TaxID=2594042 RepID=A0A5B9D8K7_9ARCH|nr:hypothetical protein [Candidatus Prometheoarchaeum syntrophicum]QEE15100.1 hypothetical protein DSAG12_00923 [Candidatus Prometheoarchaeum syntrophicum]
MFSDIFSYITDFIIEESHLSLDWDLSYSGVYYICVSGLNFGDFYDMDIRIAGLPDDWAEPNDYYYEAKHLDLGYHGGMVQNDDDFFIFSLAEG